MQVQALRSDGPTNINAVSPSTNSGADRGTRQRNRRPLHLPLALEARAAGIRAVRPSFPTLSVGELRRIVAGMLG